MIGWGRYPAVEGEVFAPNAPAGFQQRLRHLEGMGVTPRGLGRSYGDSSLGERMLSSRWLNHVLSFDEGSGVLYCEAGVSLRDILEVFVPRGWFLPVTPGTQFVTIGGAIASDVHGKNHHLRAVSVSMWSISISFWVMAGLCAVHLANIRISFVRHAAGWG